MMYPSRVQTMPTKRTLKKQRAGSRSGGRLQEAIDALVEKEIKRALSGAGGNVSEAARTLGISRRGLWKRMDTFGIDPGRYR